MNFIGRRLINRITLCKNIRFKKNVIFQSRRFVINLTDVEREEKKAKELHPSAHDQPSPQEYIESIEPIEVDGSIARCDGGDGPLGHPTEYIQLNKTRNMPETCKYCGLRYIRSHHH